MYKKKIASLAAALTLVSSVAAQSAASAAPSIVVNLPVHSAVTATIQASLSVQGRCSITSFPTFTFPAVSTVQPLSSALTATGVLSFDCGGNSSPSLTLSDGGDIFTLKNGGDSIPFTISIPVAGGGSSSINVSDSTAAPGIALLGVSNTLPLTVRLAPTSTTQLPVEGTYSDNVTATLTIS